MESILEYIMLNYTWFLGGSIVIILAIIGSYADKTNFGQGNKKEELNTRENSNFNEQVTLKEYIHNFLPFLLTDVMHEFVQKVLHALG